MHLPLSVPRSSGIVERLYYDGRDFLARRFGWQHDFFSKHDPRESIARGRLPHAHEHDVVKLENVVFSQSLCRNMVKSLQEPLGILRRQAGGVGESVLKFGHRLLGPRGRLGRSSSRAPSSSFCGRASERSW
jgi:hypothetical protein